jgi:hypothetical protein
VASDFVKFQIRGSGFKGSEVPFFALRATQGKQGSEDRKKTEVGKLGR